MNIRGVNLRVSRIIDPADGKSLCVAADHGLMVGPTKGTWDLNKTIKEVIEGRCDAVLLSPGGLNKTKELFAAKDSPAILIRGDWISGARVMESAVPFYTFKEFRIIPAEDALSLGADAVIIYYITGLTEEYERENLKSCISLARDAHKVGLPLIIEPLVGDVTADSTRQGELFLSACCRAESIGADILKVSFPKDEEYLKQLVKEVDIPVLVLGGEKTESLEPALELARKVMKIGCEGIVFGRQVIQSDSPRMVVEELRKIIHITNKIQISKSK